MAHGVLMTGWYVLFFVQTWLVRTHRVATHKRLGWFATGYAGLMVVSGIAVAIHGTGRDVRVPHFDGIPPLIFMGFLFVLIGVFAVIVAAAIMLRRRRDSHKNLMLLSLFSMLSAALFRLPAKSLGPFAFLIDGGFLGVFSLDLRLLYTCVAWNTWRHRRLHPVFALGGHLIVAKNTPLTGLFVTSPIWLHFAQWVVGKCTF